MSANRNIRGERKALKPAVAFSESDGPHPLQVRGFRLRPQHVLQRVPLGRHFEVGVALRAFEVMMPGGLQVLLAVVGKPDFLRNDQYASGVHALEYSSKQRLAPLRRNEL